MDIDSFYLNSVILPIIVPLIGGIFCFVFPRKANLLGSAFSGLTLCSVCFMAFVVSENDFVRYPLGGWGAPLGIELYVDRLSAAFLVMTAMVAFAIGLYANQYYVTEAHSETDDADLGNMETSTRSSFWAVWCLLWAGLNALYSSWDVFNIYVALELIGLSAVALVNLKASAESLRSSLRYLLVSLLGSLLYLVGVVLLYNRYGVMSLTQLSQLFSTDTTTIAATAILLVGLSMKAAIFPFHFWLPPAHGSATAPVSAILSALVVKSTFYLLLRLWMQLYGQPQFQLEVGFDVNILFGVLGGAAVLWGSLQALFQVRLKLLIAYSTVAQLGYFFLAFALVGGWKGGVMMALSHGFAKAAMFLAAGNILHFLRHDRIEELDYVAGQLPLTLAAFGLAGVSIMGLPPSGGFAGKWILLHQAIEQGQWWVAIIILLGSLLAAAYVFRAIGHSFIVGDAQPEYKEALPRIMEWSPLVLAFISFVLGLFTVSIMSWLEGAQHFLAYDMVQLIGGNNGE